MILRRLAETLRRQEWGVLALELILVVGGILLAFQLDRAYQASQDRELEQRYLDRLASDLRRDTAEISENLRRTDRRLAQLDLLEEVIREPAVAGRDPRALVLALEQVTWRSVPTITTGTYDELRTTGRTVLLRSEALRAQLSAYYGFVEEQRRLGLGEDDQDRFREETLGLLSAEDLSAVEDPREFEIRMSPEEAEEIGRAFARREGAHRWLPRLTKYQVLMARLSRDFQERARVLLREVDAPGPGEGT